MGIDVEKMREDLSRFLAFEKPIVFFDLETTGLDIQEDRVVEIAMVRFETDPMADSLLFDARLNPTIPIGEEATSVHGITNEMVSGCPTFRDVSREIYHMFDGADIAGYNVKKFDIPLLMNELGRCGLKLKPGFSVVDCCEIFHHREPRDLAGACKFYLGGLIMEDAHRAMADVEATINVFAGQLSRYKETMANTARGIDKEHQKEGQVDLAGKMVKSSDGVITLTSGKHQGVPLDRVPRSYLSWMYQNNVIGPDASHIIGDLLGISESGR